NVIFWDQKSRDAKGVGKGQQFQSSTRISDSGQTITSMQLGGGTLASLYVPGGQPIDFREYGAAQLVPANSDLVLQVHYTSVGKPVTERTRIGFTFAKTETQRIYRTYASQPASISDTNVFRIPAGAPNWSSPSVQWTFLADVDLVWMMPHMHARGKD